MGRITKVMLMVAVLMGAASAVGVLFGATLVPSLHPAVIKGLLGPILLVATVRLIVTPERRPPPRPEDADDRNVAPQCSEATAFPRRLR